MIELSDVIRELRAELAAAVADGSGQPLRFKLGVVELELSVAVQREAGGSAKVRFWVLDAGGQGSASTGTTQRIKLSLTPTLEGSDGDVLVAGETAPGER